MNEFDSIEMKSLSLFVREMISTSVTYCNLSIRERMKKRFSLRSFVNSIEVFENLLKMKSVDPIEMIISFHCVFVI